MVGGAKIIHDRAGFSVVEGAPIMTLFPSIKALFPHKNFQKTIEKTLWHTVSEQ